MSKTCNLIAYNPNIETIEYRHNFPLHPDMKAGVPWVYVDQDDVKFYAAFHLAKHNLWLVVAKSNYKDLSS